MRLISFDKFFVKLRSKFQNFILAFLRFFDSISDTLLKFFSFVCFVLLAQLLVLFLLAHLIQNFLPQRHKKGLNLLWIWFGVNFVGYCFEIAKVRFLLQNLGDMLCEIVVFLLHFADKRVVSLELIFNFTAILLEKLNNSFQIVHLWPTRVCFLSISLQVKNAL